LAHNQRLQRIYSLLLIALLVAGCAASRTAGGQPNSEPADAAAQPAPTDQGSLASPTPVGRPMPPKVGNVAWDFVLPNMQGEQVRLSDLRGKHVMLSFWATWCGPCRSEIPAMVKLYEEMDGQDFEILAINMREDSAKVQPFVQELNMDFPVLFDTNGKLAQAYYVRGIPTSIFIDDEGVIQIVHVGTLSDKLLRDYVKRLMD